MVSASSRLDDPVWLAARRAERWSVVRLAGELGVDRHQVSAALRRAGLPLPLPRQRPFPQLHDVEWLSHALATRCVADVARSLGCTPHPVRDAARKYGVPVLVDGRRPPVSVAQRLSDPLWLSRRRAQGARQVDLAVELGVSVALVAAALRQAGLPPLRHGSARPQFPRADSAGRRKKLSELL